MEWSANDIDNIINNINDRNKYDQVGECRVWKGKLHGKNCRISYKNNNIIIANFILEQAGNVINPNDEIIRTCSTGNTCIKLEHLQIIPFISDKIKKWNEMFILENYDTNDNQCFLWKKLKNNGGYGHTSLNGSVELVHRVSYWIWNTNPIYENISDIPTFNKLNERLYICHSCHNTNCFNPKHLRLDTAKKNSEDQIDNGTTRRGEKNTQALISDELAKTIKWSKYPKADERYKSQKDRAIQFEVPLKLVQRIDCGETYAWILDNEGKTSDKVKKRSAKAKKIAATREWTKDIWDEAQKRLHKDLKINGTCWIWGGNPKRNGDYEYGKISVSMVEISTTRLAYSLITRVRVPDHITIKHSNDCKSSLCINPDHLIAIIGKIKEKVILDNDSESDSEEEVKSDPILTLEEKKVLRAANRKEGTKLANSTEWSDKEWNIAIEKLKEHSTINGNCIIWSGSDRPMINKIYIRPHQLAYFIKDRIRYPKEFRIYRNKKLCTNNDCINADHFILNDTRIKN